MQDSAEVNDITIVVGLDVWSRTACGSELARGTRVQVDSPRRVMCRSCGNFSRLRGPVASARADVRLRYHVSVQGSGTRSWGSWCRKRLSKCALAAESTPLDSGLASEPLIPGAWFDLWSK
jgi:hypothetical protein